MNEDEEIPVPLWVLKGKVETDWEEYLFLSGGDIERFPVYDSTIEVLKILEKRGIKFNKETREWE